MPELFPATPRTWIDDRLTLGDAGAADLNREILRLYFQPLCGYTQASSLRELGEVDEIVSGFLSNRLARGDYLRSWRENEAMPLRRWLMNGLHLYGHELRRARNNRSTRETSLDASGAAATASAPDVAGVVGMERAWTLTVVREACAEIESELRFAGVEIDWYVFRRHFIDGRPYRELFAETGIEPARAAVRSHAILVKLRSRIRAILARDGTPADEIEHELARMQRTVEESRP